jgi:hypothetical protein
MSDPNPLPAIPSQRGFIASPWHTLSILLFFLYMVVSDAHHAREAASAGTVAPHGTILRGYLLSILFACGIALWCWAGVHWKGGTLRDLTGGRWTSWKSAAVDFAIAIPFWLVWEGTARLMHRLVNGVATATTPYQQPSGAVEVLLWLLVSVAAGIGEEFML